MVPFGECRKNGFRRVGPKTADPEGDRDPFRDTPHAESQLLIFLMVLRSRHPGAIFGKIAVNLAGDRNVRFA